MKLSELLKENENLSIDYDPKCAWALKHPEFFPMDVNTASLEELIRIPGIGIKSAYKIISARRYGRLSLEDLAEMTGGECTAQEIDLFENLLKELKLV